MKLKQVRLLKSYKMEVKNIKIQQFSIPAEKAVNTFSFPPIAVEDRKTCNRRTWNTRTVSMLSGGNQYSFTTLPTFSETNEPQKGEIKW